MLTIKQQGIDYSDESKYFGSQILNRDTSISINSHCYLTGVERTKLANNINQIGKIFSEHTGNNINSVWIGVFDIGELDTDKFKEREVKDREEKYLQNSIHVRFRDFKVLVYSWLDINQFSQDQWNNFLLQLKRDHEVNFIGAGPLTFKYKDFNYRVYPPLFVSSDDEKSFLNNPEVYNFSPTEVNKIIEDIEESHQSIEKKIASYYESLGKDFVKNGKGYIHIKADIGKNNVKNFTDVSYTNSPDGIHNKPIKEAFVKDDVGGNLLHSYVYENKEALMKFMFKLNIFNDDSINAVDANGKTPLHLAAEYGRGAMVEMLLNKKAKVDIADNRGKTPLHLAAQYNEKKEIVEMLLNQGAKVDIADNRGRTPLHFAARNNNKEVVKALLDKGGIDVNAKNKSGWTPLHLAANHDHKEVVEVLLKGGANVNVQNDKEETPLHFAARNNNKEVVKALLGKGANVDVQNDKGETPLHFAARNNNKEVVKALLDKDGINVNAQDNSGCTPLHFAALNGYKEVVKALLDKGANVNAKDKEGNTPLKLATDDKIKTLLQNTAELLKAAKKGDIDDVQNLLDEEGKAQVNAKDNNGCTPLHLAARNGKKDVVKALLGEDGIDVNAQNDKEETPLHFAAENGEKDVVKALLDKGANVNAQNDKEETPLHSVLKKKKIDIDIVKTLLGAKDINVNAVDQYGETPLHFAAENDHKEVVEVLLKADVIDINAQDNDGCTPLHLAAVSGHKQVVQALLDKGANVNAQNDEGKTPSNLATDEGIQNLLQSVREANGKLLEAAESGNIDDVKNLLGKEGKAQVNATDETGETPLHWAAVRGHKEVVKALLGEDGIDVNAKDNSGGTPLHWAAVRGHKEVVEALLDKDGIDVNAKDNDGNTPLHFAVFKGNQEVVKALLDKGANVNAQNDEGKTPLDLANNKGIQNLLQSVKEANDKLLKAAESGNIDDVKNLLGKEGKAQVNATDETGETPLHWAAVRGHKEVVKALLGEDGIDVNAKDNSGGTPLHWAAVRGHKEVVEALLDKDGIDVNAKDNDGNTPLHFAVFKGNQEVVKALLDKGANVNAQNDEGKTPLDLANNKGIQNLLQSVKEANDKLLKAAESGNIDDVKNLLGKEGKAQVNATDETGETPLHWAAVRGHKEVVKALLGEDGIDVNAKDNSGGTPLHWAAVRGHKEVVEALLDKDGIDVNAKDNDGNTPLHFAVFKGNQEVVKALLDKGANVNAQNDEGKTPLDLANNKGIQNLLQSVKEANDKLLKAAESGNIDDVKNLLGKEGKAQVNATDETGETPLHWAAQNNKKEVVDALIKAGANINVKDKDEKTPFDLTTDEEIKTLFQKAAESPDAGLIDEPSTDSKGVQEEDAGTEKKEKQEGDAQSGSDIAEKGTGVSNGSQPTGPTQNNGGQPTTSAGQGTDVATGSAQPIAPIEPAQTEEQPSSFFGSLFSILMKPFSLVASFFGGFFSWLFGSDEPIQSSSESDQPVVLYQFSIIMRQMKKSAFRL